MTRSGNENGTNHSPYPIYFLRYWMVERPLAVAFGKNCLAFFGVSVRNKIKFSKINDFFSNLKSKIKEIETKNNAILIRKQNILGRTS